MSTPKSVTARHHVAAIAVGARRVADQVDPPLPGVA